MKTFEEKLVEILEKVENKENKEITPIEYALSNEPSKTKGKVNQLVTFMYEADEPVPELEKENPSHK